MHPPSLSVTLATVVLAFVLHTLGGASDSRAASLPQVASATNDTRLPAIGAIPPFVSSASCRECHEKEHESWHRSFHRTMTQVATPGSVLGRFDGATIQSDGLAYRVYREGNQLMAEMPDPDVMMYVVQGGKKLPFSAIPRVRLPVVMSTGSHHYQTYWVASSRYPGLLQTLPLVYLLEDQRWAPREEAFLRGPADKERLVTQWNHHCIRCHSTGGNPGLDEASGMLKTKVAELGISCEACHGPADDHVKKQRELKLQGASLRPEKGDPLIVNPSLLDSKRSSQVCGQCHGVFTFKDEFAMQSAREGALFRPGEDLHRTRYYMQHPNAAPSPSAEADLRRNPDFFRERWWDDGTILAGGREYTALLGSKCHQKGDLSCLSCHSMHKSDPVDQLRADMDGPASCVKCHREPKYTTEVARHTFHQAGSSGNNCLNCHMPFTTYALFKAIRSHQISSPSVEASARHGTPNACNLCHLDKTLAWTQDRLRERYGKAKVPLTQEQSDTSAVVLWLLQGHAAQRAVTAWNAGWEEARKTSGAEWLAPFLAPLLADDYGVVRYVAARSLRSLPGFQKFDYDFLAPPAELRARASAAAAHWSQLPSNATNPGPAVLLDLQGCVLDEKFQALLDRRDNRSVTVKE